MVAFIKVIEGELLSNGQLSPHQLLKNLHVIQWWSLFSLLLNSFLITYGSWYYWCRCLLSWRWLLRKENIVRVNPNFKKMLHIIRFSTLTSSSSECHFFFVLEEFGSHALNCGVSPLWPLRNEVRKVVLRYLEQVVW